MRIAQIAPLDESVPPRTYGGSERIASYLTEELVRAGHEVTLFASGDSVTRARLVPCSRRGLRSDPKVYNRLLYHLAMLEKVMQQADQFDVLHFHTEVLHLPVVRPLRGKSVTTLHGLVDTPELKAFYRAFADAPLVAISEDQRSTIPGGTVLGTVHNGLPRELLPFRPRPRGDYLAFMGRISPLKGVERAIEIAGRAGLPLKIAAKVDDDREYWREVIRPLVDADPLVEFLGEIGDHEKGELLGDALAVLFPIEWREPFGLVMIEAMACGTPTIGWRRGAVPEVIEEGLSGIVVDSIGAAVRAVEAAAGFDRRKVRDAFERRFTADRMAAGYLAAYEKLITRANAA